MEEFQTIDIDNNTCTFQYKQEESQTEGELIFKVYSVPDNPFRWFTFRVKLNDDGTAKSEMLNSNTYTEFAKKGIPEAIIPIAANALGRSILSSPLNGEPGNFLVGPSKKAWERLVAIDENANIDEEKDCYKYTLDL